MLKTAGHITTVTIRRRRRVPPARHFFNQLGPRNAFCSIAESLIYATRSGAEPGVELLGKWAGALMRDVEEGEIYRRGPRRIDPNQVLEGGDELRLASCTQPLCITLSAIGAKAQMFSDQAVDQAEGVRKFDPLENSNLPSCADSRRDGDVISHPAEDQNRGAVESGRIERAGRMRELMIHGDDLRSLAQQLSDQTQSLHSILELMEAGGLVVNRFGGGFRQEPSVEFDRPSHQASRLVVICDVVDVLDTDAGGFKAVPDGLVRQPSGLADADAVEARQFLFLNGGDDPPVFEQRR